MKKFSYLVFLFIVSLGVIAGCSSNDANENVENNQEASENTEATEEGEFPVTVTDATGDELTFDDKAEKIVSVLPSNTEIAFALGLEDEIVGVTELDNYPEEAQEKETVGDFEINVEKVISLEPDVVLADESVNEDALNQLRDADVQVLVVETATNFEEVYDAIDMIAKVTDTTEEADEIEADMEEKLSSLEEKVAEIEEPKSVYVEISPSPETFTAGKGTFIDTILERINAENSAGDLEGWPEVNEEAVIEMNPDVILTTYGSYVDDPVKEVTDRKGWSDITAVEDEQIFDVNEDLVSRPGPRLVEGAEELAKAIYPDVFAN